MKTILSDRMLAEERWVSEVDHIDSVFLKTSFGRFYKYIPEWMRLCICAPRYKYIIVAASNNIFWVSLCLTCLPFIRTKLIAREFTRIEEGTQKFYWLRENIRQIIYRRIDAFIVHARAEVGYYSKRFNIPSKKFHFIPFYSKQIGRTANAHEGRYIFSAGRHYRDFPLLSMACEELGVQCMIVSDHISLPKNKTGNTTQAYYEIPYEKYRGLLEGAGIVVLPLPDITKSIGQVVLLEAMGLGKAVVVTKAPGTVDYIQDGVDGLFYRPGDKEDLKQKLKQLLANDKLRTRLSENALSYANSSFSIERFSQRVLDIVANQQTFG